MSVLVLLLSLLPAAVLGASGSSSSTLESSRNAYRIIAGSNLNFTNALYQVLSRNEGNVFFSPLSIQVILALAAQGAVGETQREMVSGLLLPQDQQVTRNGFRQLLKVLRNNDGETVKIANKIYTDRKYPPTTEFLQIAQQYFQSDGEKVNFETESEQVRQKINQWVEANTANKIRDLLSEGSLSEDTVMLLVNCVYFKGTWSTRFDPTKTVPRPFYVSPQVQQTVNMMHVKVADNFAFKEDEQLDAKILEIPYVGATTSLVIILPNKRFGLRDVETKLARMEIRQLFKEMYTPEVHVRLPRFKLEQSIDLKDTLQQMGMGLMFSNGANFSGIASGPTKISKVVHKAFIDVNEEGAEAAASTAVQSILLSALSEETIPILFNADHPFLFILRHSRTGGILFMGRYVRPT